MENLHDTLQGYNDGLVFAVIDNDNQVVDILDDFHRAWDYAMDIGACCVETWKHWNGRYGNFANGVVMESYTVAQKPNLWKQRFYALIMIMLSVLSIPMLDGDATLAVFVLPITICIMFSKKYLLVD